MRLKEDSSGYKAEGLKAKLKLIPEQPHTKSKKDTRKWCKGKVGREHDYEVRQPTGGMFARGTALEGFMRMPVCKNCGKQDYYGIEYKQKDGSYGKHPDWHRHE